MTMVKAKADKCYKCGTELTTDPVGYSPPCAWCPKCNMIRDNNYDEGERIMLQAKREEKERILEIINEYIKTDLQGNPLPECKILWEIKARILKVRER